MPAATTTSTTRSRRPITTRSTACSPARTEPRELPLIEEVQRTPELIAFEKEVSKREAEYNAEVEKRYRAHLKKLREPAVVAEYLRGAFDSRGKEDRPLQMFARERDLIPYALTRWRDFLEKETQGWSPVFGPLAPARRPAREGLRAEGRRRDRRPG